MMLMFIFLCLLLPSFVISGNENYNITIDEDMELERQLKLLNKPAIKTIVDNGDIYDCVDMYKQPAFDHPSLKDHQLQLKPTSYPVEVYDGISPSSSSSSSSSSSRNKTTSMVIGLKNGGCPLGTVPIRRVRKEDFIRMRSSLKHKKIMMRSPSNSNNDPQYQELAVLMTLDDKPFKFYGAFASIGAYGLPQVKLPQYSSSLIWLENSMNKDQHNILSAGWSVEPSLYGDSQTRLSTAWTNDGFHGTGCHDVVCPGFVQVSGEIPVGTPIGPLSIPHGQQYSLHTYLYLDPQTQAWWLALGENKKVIGYWPSKIFSTLGQFATQLQYGGVVGYSGSDRPPMGSGLPAEMGAGSACYFKRVQYVDQQNQLHDLKPSDTYEHETYPRCYEIGSYAETQGADGNMFYFGGDGHC